MPKKTPKTLRFPPVAVKILIIVGLALAVGCILTVSTLYFFTKSSYFKIKSVRRDSSLSFISNRDLDGLLNKNIFKVDLISLEHKLSKKYPEAAQLKIIKHYPNQISIEAKRRIPFVQLALNKMTIVLDEKSVIILTRNKQDDSLPVIVGVPQVAHVSLGMPLHNEQIDIGIAIAQSFVEEKALTSFKLKKIEVDNLSRIVMTLDGGLLIIMDDDDLGHKMKVLSVILAHEQLDMKKVKYIDLRFKEPILGKK